MKLNHLSNQELHLQTKLAADKERLSTIEVLWHLRENERRMLYAQMGFKDLKEYCIKELKLSEGSAWRRIAAMRLLKEIPEIEFKIQNGNLNLTQISMMNTHCRQVKSTKNEKQENSNITRKSNHEGHRTNFSRKKTRWIRIKIGRN